MTLTLTITSYQARQAGQVAMKTVDRRGLSIGRGSENDWVLADPDRHLSKRHCVIEYAGGRYSVTDTSTNGVFVNRSPEPIGRGNAVELGDGDKITLGDYEIEANLAEAAPFADAQQIPEPLPADIVDPIADERDPFGIAGAQRQEDPFAPASGGDPFAPPGGGRGAMIPEDEDIFGEAGGRREAWGRQAEPDHVPAEQVQFSPPRVIDQKIPDDWDDEPAGGPGGGPGGAPGGEPEEAPWPAKPAAPARPRQRTHPPAAPRTVAPPQARAARPPARGAPPAEPPRGGGDAGAALSAFLAGAGIDPAAAAGQDPEALMRLVGAVFREMVSGLRENLMARAAIKNEFRLDQTMVRAAENNPLKFSISVEEALGDLLGRPQPGYLEAAVAVREGFHDIKAHQMAMMAGMQTALTGLLKQFDPEQLKARMDDPSMLGSILPAAKKAKYWELYEQMFRQIAGEAESDFNGQFGREFARAYEAQAKKL